MYLTKYQALIAILSLQCLCIGLESPDLQMTFPERLEIDNEIHHEVRKAMAKNPLLIPFLDTINVQVINGVVTLTGTVDSSKAKYALTQQIQWLKGVNKVVNRVQVIVISHHTNPPH